MVLRCCQCRPKDAIHSTSGLDEIALEMGESFQHCRFNGLAAPFYFAHQHRALHRSDAEVSHALGFGAFGKVSPRFLSDEESSQLVLDDFEDETEVLTNQF